MFQEDQQKYFTVSLTHQSLTLGFSLKINVTKSTSIYCNQINLPPKNLGAEPPPTIASLYPVPLYPCKICDFVQVSAFSN